MKKRKILKNIPAALVILGLTSTPVFADNSSQEGYSVVKSMSESDVKNDDSNEGISFVKAKSNNEHLDISDSLLELKKDQKQIDSQVEFENNPFFKNAPIDEEREKAQKEFITNLQKKYFDKGDYSEGKQEELNNLFVNFISLGMNEAADAIWNNKNVKIDISRYSENGLTPLMAAAITPIDGGNIEYAIKLVNKGADVNQGAKKSDISPVSLASTVDNYKVVAYLILKGAKFMSQDKLELRPIDYALRNNSVKSAAVIKESLDVVLDRKHQENQKSKDNK